jgi:hypothetical protein
VPCHIAGRYPQQADILGQISKVIESWPSSPLARSEGHFAIWRSADCPRSFLKTLSRFAAPPQRVRRDHHPFHPQPFHKEQSHMKPKLSAVASTFHAAGYTEADTTRILKTLMSGGHVDLENGVTPAGALHAVAGTLTASTGTVHAHPRLRTPGQAAEDQNLHPLLRQVVQMAKRYNLTIDSDQYVDPSRLQKELDSSRATTEEKIRTKTAMAMCGLLI